MCIYIYIHTCTHTHYRDSALAYAAEKAFVMEMKKMDRSPELKKESLHLSFIPRYIGSRVCIVYVYMLELKSRSPVIQAKAPELL
jgi:hypothetical protein